MLILSVLFLIDRINTGDYTIDRNTSGFGYCFAFQILIIPVYQFFIPYVLAVQYQTITFQICFHKAKLLSQKEKNFVVQHSSKFFKNILHNNYFNE